MCNWNQMIVSNDVIIYVRRLLLIFQLRYNYYYFFLNKKTCKIYHFINLLVFFLFLLSMDIFFKKKLAFSEILYK